MTPDRALARSALRHDQVADIFLFSLLFAKFSCATADNSSVAPLFSTLGHSRFGRVVNEKVLGSPPRQQTVCRLCSLDIMHSLVAHHRCYVSLHAVSQRLPVFEVVALQLKPKNVLEQKEVISIHFTVKRTNDDGGGGDDDDDDDDER